MREIREFPYTSAAPRSLYRCLRWIHVNTRCELREIQCFTRRLGARSSARWLPLRFAAAPLPCGRACLLESPMGSMDEGVTYWSSVKRVKYDCLPMYHDKR